MRYRLSGPLAAALLLAVASVPCPASWLDDTTHNVGVEDILAPRGTIDSGVAVTPVAVVANYGTSVESLWTFFAIDDGTPGGFLDSLWLTGLAPAGRETVAFPNWIPRGRDSMSATAWTQCEGDTFPQDDTARGRFLVRVTDVAVTQIVVPAPDTVLDSGDIVYMQCRVWNFGNRSINFDLRFRIYELDSTIVFEAFRNINLISGGATLVTSPDSWVAVPGVYMAECAALVLGDLHPENNVMRDTFYVRGTTTVDVAALAVLSPTGVIDTTMTIVPEARYGNEGVDSVEFWTFFIIRNSSGATIYAESSQVPLGPNRTSDVEYPSIKFHVLGNYTAACSVYMPGDQNSTNDVKKVMFRVVPRVSGDIGIVEIIWPDTMPPDTPAIYGAVWKNYGSLPMTYSAFLVILNKYGVRMYTQVWPGITLDGGEVDTLCIPGFNMGNDTGLWAVFCSTASGDSNPSNDTMRKWFYVRVGIEEGQPQAPSHKPQATVVRRLPAGAVAFDATGRRVANPKPGVYFVVEQSAFGSQYSGTESGARNAAHVRKVIIQR